MSLWSDLLFNVDLDNFSFPLNGSNGYSCTVDCLADLEQIFGVSHVLSSNSLRQQHFYSRLTKKIEVLSIWSSLVVQRVSIENCAMNIPLAVSLMQCVLLANEISPSVKWKEAETDVNASELENLLRELKKPFQGKRRNHEVNEVIAERMIHRRNYGCWFYFFFWTILFRHDL